MINELRYFTFVIALLVMSIEAKAECADSTMTSPHISFAYREVSLGEVSQSCDSIKSHEFVFTNTGRSRLVIVNVATGCGCTQATYTKEAISPGSKGTVTVTYNASRQKKGPFRKSITVFSNDPRSYVRIFISGVVTE